MFKIKNKVILNFHFEKKAYLSDHIRYILILNEKTAFQNTRKRQVWFYKF